MLKNNKNFKNIYTKDMMQTFLRRHVCDSHTGKALKFHIPGILHKSHSRKHSPAILGEKIIASWKVGKRKRK